jgi:hypothetical protein
VFGDTRIEGGRVGDAAVSVLGDNYVNAAIDGDVVAVLGDVELGPNANVRGNVVVIGGVLKRDPAAQVRGGVQHVMSMPTGALTGLRAWLENCGRYFRPLAFAPGLGWAWTIALGFLALYAFLALMFREPVDRCVKTLQEHPGQTVLASLLAMLLTPVLFVVLCITVIGIAFIPIASFGIFLATLFGKAVVLAWIGRSCSSSSTMAQAAPALAVSRAVPSCCCSTVPVLGFLILTCSASRLRRGGVYAAACAQARRRNAPPAFCRRWPRSPFDGRGFAAGAGARRWFAAAARGAGGTAARRVACDQRRGVRVGGHWWRGSGRGATHRPPPCSQR